MVVHTRPSPSAAARAQHRSIAVLASALAVLAATLPPLPACAQAGSDADVCVRGSSGKAEHEARIAACTRIISATRNQGASASAAYLNRGEAHAALGQRERAIQDYDEAIRLDPSQVRAYVDRGISLAALGQRERAVQDYGQVVRLDPNNAAGYNGRCYSLAVLGRAADGLPDCERALQLHPNDPNILDSRAYAYLRIGRLNEALRDYDAALAAGNGPISRFGRAIVRAGLGNRSGAIADLAEARRLNPTVDSDAARINLSAPTFAAEPAAAAPTVPPPASANAAPAVGRDVLFWQSIQASTNVGDFEAYLRQFPNGAFAELARNRIVALRPATAAAAPAPAAAGDLTIVPPTLSWVLGTGGQATLVIQGVIRNGAAAPRAIPPLRVILRAGEVEIHSWTFAAATPQAGASAEVAYRTQIVDPPQALTTLSVVFATAR
jgi:tetratricopeptide (TPR) repeat protein